MPSSICHSGVSFFSLASLRVFLLSLTSPWPLGAKTLYTLGFSETLRTKNQRTYIDLRKVTERRHMVYMMWQLCFGFQEFLFASYRRQMHSLEFAKPEEVHFEFLSVHPTKSGLHKNTRFVPGSYRASKRATSYLPRLSVQGSSWVQRL